MNKRLCSNESMYGVLGEGAIRVLGAAGPTHYDVLGVGPSGHSVQLDPHFKSMYRNWVPYQG